MNHKDYAALMLEVQAIKTLKLQLDALTALIDRAKHGSQYRLSDSSNTLRLKYGEPLGNAVINCLVRERDILQATFAAYQIEITLLDSHPAAVLAKVDEDDEPLRPLPALDEDDDEPLGFRPLPALSLDDDEDEDDKDDSDLDEEDSELDEDDEDDDEFFGQARSKIQDDDTPADAYDVSNYRG
jgi:hypothetical protein